MHEIISKYETLHEEGFIRSEIEKLLTDNPEINKDSFYDALRAVTCIKIDGEFVIYNSDIAIAIACGLENRKMTDSEFD